MEGWQSLQWYDWMRMITATLAFIGLYRCTQMFRVRRAKEKVDRRKPEPRLDDFFWVVAATMVVLIVGNIEQISGNTEFRSAGILGLMISLVTLRASRAIKEPLTHL